MLYSCAPLEGLTGRQFRKVHQSCFPGADRYYMPFLSPAQGHVFSPKELRELDPDYNRGIPVIPQLLTRRAEDFVWAAGELAAMGYREVNLNLGCPSGTVTAKGKGAGFLGRLEELEGFLDEIFAHSPLPISIKTRLGVQEAEEFEAILQLYAQYPLRELILHPRVQKDLYRRPVRNQWYGFALERVKFPLCGNGDLNTPEDARALTETYPGLERLMFGRGLMADPALISRQKGGPPASRGDLQRFHDALYEHYIQDFGSPHSAMMRMKEHWSYLITRFRDHEKHAKHLKKAQNPQDFRRWAQAVFQELDLV